MNSSMAKISLGFIRLRVHAPLTNFSDPTLAKSDETPSESIPNVQEVPSELQDIDTHRPIAAQAALAVAKLGNEHWLVEKTVVQVEVKLRSAILSSCFGSVYIWWS